MSYPVVRFFLGIQQVVGLVLAIVLVIAGIGMLPVSMLDAVRAIVFGIFVGGINHALCGVGLALLDLVERYLAKNPWPSQIEQRKQMPRDHGPAPAPIPQLMTPIPREQLLEDGSATPAPKQLVITGDIAPSRPLGEDDLARLEAEQKRKAKR